MLKKIYIRLIVFFWGAWAYSQSIPHYLPYELPTHSAVKFNTFVMNPAFPLMGLQEHNVGLYYRGRSSRYDTAMNSVMGLSYGLKWDDLNSVNTLIFKRDVGIMSNLGAVINYGHMVEITDDMALRLGLNVIPSYSGVDKGRIRLTATPVADEVLLENIQRVFGITAQPGFDFNVGKIHFGVTAENIFDYSFTNSDPMTSFADKTFTAHAMYRSPIENGTDFFEGGHWSVMGRFSKDGDQSVISGNALLDLPKLGFAYGGYSQKYGAFVGIGFNLNDRYSIGFEYENAIGVKIPQLGSTFSAHLNIQFGGDRHKSSMGPRPNNTRAAARARAAGRITNQTEGITKPKPEPKKPEPKPEPKPVVPVKEPEPKAPEPEQQLHNVEVKAVVDKTVGDKIPPGNYVVIGVYRDPKIAFKFIQEMRKKYDVASFVHPVKKFTYVYLNSISKSAEHADELYKKNVYNKDFPSGIWVLRTGN